MDGIPLLLLTCLILTERIVDAADCNTKFSEALFRKNFAFSASSEDKDYTASEVFTFGWCAATNTGTPHIDVDFKLPYGISGITIQGPTGKGGQPYPKSVLVMYVPNGGDVNNFTHFPLQGGKLEIKLNQPGQAQSNFAKSVAVRKLRFIIQSFSGEACLKIDLTGCTINELCSGGCQQNGGLCVMEDTCQCPQGSLGDNCELKACVPAALGLADGRIGADQVTASSQDPVYNVVEIGNSGSKKGWCPALTDQSPWVQIKLYQPKAVSIFEFSWSGNGPNNILTEFELQYIAAVDSSRRFRTFATDIPAMNNTHIFTVTITPAVVTDTIRIIPSKWITRPCFKLEIQGCDPTALCSANWCLNGGSCIGQNVCKCPSGFVGSRCEQSTSNITATNMTFVRIENNSIVTTTASLQFHVTGNVNLQVIENKPVVSISGTNSYITLHQTTETSSCVTDINHCTNGFTFTIDVNFGLLLDNTFIISSGGHLPDHSGITLYYANNQLHYIVSTTTQIWTVVVSYPPVLHQWQHFELTWNKHLGIEILVNGHTLGSNSRPSSRPTSSKIVNLCIGCSHSTTSNVNINMLVTAIHSWFLDRTELVNAGVKEPPATTSIPGSTPTSTVATTKTIDSTTTKLTSVIATTTHPAAKCVPENLGLADGRIGADKINVSSEDTEYNKEEIGNANGKKGWCPAVTDHSPWVQVKLDQPKAVSVFRFSWSGKGSHTILREFELQYIPAIDSTRRFRSYAKDLPAMNNTHVLEVTITPVVITDTIRVIPSKWDNRPCFKLEIQGCDPKALCSNGWCLNGGTCMGENVCACPTGYVGSRCEQKTNEITATNMTFVKIENNIISTTTATLQFLVTGNVQLQVIENKQVVSINGTNSSIVLNQTTGTSSCVTDINHCTNGFTFTIDVNFGQLLNNTYIISSGGHLPDHSGITLYYANNQLHYIVSTTTQIWTMVVNYPPVLHQWQHFELTWNKHLGIEILVNGHTLGSNSRPSFRPTSSKIVNLCIGCSHSSTGNGNINIQVAAIVSWSLDRTVLVNAGVKEPPATTTTPATTATSTVATTTLSVTRCVPENLGLADGRIGANQINVSSQDTDFNKEEIGNADDKKGWCPAVTDHSPWVQVKLDQAKAVSVFNFYWSGKGSHTILREFELQYIPAIDSSRRFRSYAKDMPAMNNTHIFVVTITPAVVTDTIRIIPSKWDNRPCFKLEIQGCDPKVLCSAGWCMNGGTCMGENVCVCPNGFVGSRCEQITSDITATNMTFVKIVDNIIVTTAATLQFHVTGNVQLQVIENKPVVLINGTNSYITLNHTAGTPSCVTDINHCTNGFTFTIDVNFGQLSNNTYIISSGGHLPDHSGITLYYANNQLHYIVSTTTQIWTVIVSYPPVLHQWQHFELTWNKHLGIEILVNGHSLGSNSRPSPRPTSSKIVNLCIACSHSTTGNVNIIMQITAIHSWSFDRTELVNAGVKEPPVTATTPKMSTAPVTSSSPTSMLSFQQFNLSFLSIVDNILITPSFNFTLHNKPALELENNSRTALVLDCLKEQYIELPYKGIPCLESLEDCNDGFTFKLEVLFTKLEPAKKMYILSSGGDVIGSNGMAIYIHSYQLIFGVKFGFQHWTDNYDMTGIIKENKWYKFEVSWNATKGILVLIDGYEVIKTSYWTPSPLSTKTNSVLIGKTEGANETACIKVRDLFTWTTHREVLVDHGIVQAPSTSAPTKTPAPTTTVKTTVPTTTQIPVPTFSWNLTTVTDNIIIGNHYNLTVHGSPIVSSVGIQIKSATQYIEFGSHKENCLIQPETCFHGLTIRFTIMFKMYSENTYFFTSGGQLPDGVGLAIVYRFGKIHFILTTTNQSWFINCKKNEIPPNKYHTIMLSWQLSTGLEVFVNNILVEETKIPDPHQSALLNATTVYFGKQPTTSVKVDFVLQTITIWYVHVDILVEQGKCEPPVRPTTTQSTKVTTAPTKPTATTNRVTFSSLMTTSGPQQCPAGCVSITTAQSSPTKPVTTAKPPVTATTRKSTTSAPTTKPKPSATTSSFVPTPDTATPPPPTTRKPIPDFNQFPTIHVTVEKDNNAYIACAFKPTTAKDVQIEASLHVEGKIRLVITVSGNTGLAMFAVSKVDMYLYSKEIKCSVKAHYIGSSLTTQSFFSSVFRPLITVTPGRVIVIEGHSKEFVTVTSTAPPQFYCCDGCKGQCQVHIVGTFHYERYFQKCNRDYIAQAVIESIKPPNFSEHICGYALTVQNWNQKNKIEIKATIDGRRDGDHTIKLDIIGNVYNQPPTAQITVKPYSFTVTAVQVTVKDNDHGLSQCKSVNDPHLNTFDGQHYDNMMAGEFILFRHTTLPFEVRAIYYKCSKRSHATCNCAVAVKSGDDVIAVTGCQGFEGGHPGQGHGIGLLLQQMFGSHGHAHGHNKDELAKTPMTIQIYKNGELTPGTYIRRIGCGQKYEIELPTGMVVTVQQSWKPFINIWIQGSSSDRNQAEGLCGNFDGSRTNDLKPSVSSFINRWKVNNGVFFNGVGVSSHTVTSTYCSCVHGKDKVCLAGVGAFRCASSRYDITATLVQHAKRPVLSRRKRQADTDPVPPSTEIPPDENDFTYEEAEKKCYDTIMSSKVTTSCQPILTSNLTQQIENCAHDYNATGNFEWSADALRDIIVDCVEAANTLRVANETGNTNVTDEFPDIENIDEVLGKLEVCLEDCGEHGNCTDGVCVCEDGYSGIHCNISKETKPTVLTAPYLCDVMDTSDCMAAPIFGDNFVNSDTLSCHYEFLKIGEEVADTGDKGKVRAVYISINQVTCPLPRLQSARLSVSNDGQAQSDNTTIHVVYSSVCFECTVTPTCTRKDNNCLIDGVCYEDSVTRPGDNCQICRPVANSSEWSRNNIDECLSEPVAIVQNNDKEKTQILALAIVCGVLAAIILIGLIYCIKSRMGKKSPKGVYGEYDFTGSPNLHRDPFNAVNNFTYDEKM